MNLTIQNCFALNKMKYESDRICDLRSAFRNSEFVIRIALNIGCFTKSHCCGFFYGFTHRWMWMNCV